MIHSINVNWQSWVHNTMTNDYRYDIVSKFECNIPWSVPNAWLHEVNDAWLVWLNRRNDSLRPGPAGDKRVDAMDKKRERDSLTYNVNTTISLTVLTKLSYIRIA